MKGVVADFTKMAAGLFTGIFVLIIAYGMIASIGNTECWRNTVKDLESKLSGTGSDILKPALGNENEFYVILPIAGCLNSVWFVERDDWTECGKACEDFGGSFEVVDKCKQDCYKKCGIEKGDCIVLVPTRVGSEAPWYKAYQWAAFWMSNKPVIFSSGNKELDFGGLEKMKIDWDIGDEELIVTRNGVDSEDSFKDSTTRCLLFRSSDKKIYGVELRETCGDES